MPKPIPHQDSKVAALLRVASYLSRPQKFMAVAEARAEMRRTLELAELGSVVLTTHGEPEAAVVPFATLEDIRRALLHLLVEEMETNFERSQESASAGDDPAVTSEAELETLVGDALREARRDTKRARVRARR